MMQTRQKPWVQQIFLFVLFVIFSASVQAHQQAVKVPVEDRSNKARAEAEKTALEEMLVRLTGQADARHIAGVDTILSNASAWVDQYSYEKEDGQQYLLFGFDEKQLRDELADIGAPLWSEVRPEVVVWWVKQHRDVVAQDEAVEDVHQSLLAQAERRGVPLRFPAMDNRDRDYVAASDIRGQFNDQIARATENYSTALAVTVLQESDQRLRWQLLNKQQVLDSGVITAEDEEHLGKQLSDIVANTLGEHFAVAGGDLQAFAVVVKGVRALQEWRQLETILQGQAGVKSVNLRRLEAERLLLAVEYAGAVEQLKQVLVFRNELSACPSDSEAALTLCWR